MVMVVLISMKAIFQQHVLPPCVNIRSIISDFGHLRKENGATKSKNKADGRLTFTFKNVFALEG
jgi:hypothetical protein